MTTTLTPAMNPEIRTRWTGRLRSGTILQGKAYLRMGERRCCLGVLCDMAAEAEVIEARPADGYYDDDDDALFIPDPDGRWDYGQEEDEEILPEAVQDWAGLSEANPLVRVPDAIIAQLTAKARSLLSLGDVPNRITLAQLNDANVPFPVIAEIIDATL